MHLSFVFFRKAQRLIAMARARAEPLSSEAVGGRGDGTSGTGLGHGRVDWNVQAVYFTEADQVVYMDDVRTILASLGSQVVIAPNRLNQEWCGLEPFRPGAFLDNSSVCNHR